MYKKSLIGLLVVMGLTMVTCSGAEPILPEQVLNVGTFQSAESIDPYSFEGVSAYIVVYNLYDSLIYPTPDPNKPIIPWVAKSWTISEDHKTWTFYL